VTLGHEHTLYEELKVHVPLLVARPERSRRGGGCRPVRSIDSRRAFRLSPGSRPSRRSTEEPYAVIRG